jgi:drebrin-like protein
MIPAVDQHYAQADVSPALIMKRVEAASGANYSTHKEQARKFEPIAPVGTNYTPIGKVDIGALRKAPTQGAGASASKPAIPSAPRPSYGSSASTRPAASFNAPTTGRAPVGAWDDEAPAAAAAPPPPPPTASRPPVITSARPTAPVSVLPYHILLYLIIRRPW